MLERSGEDGPHEAVGAPRPRGPGRPAPATCSLSQTLEVVGERWTFLIMREALAGTTRFSGFRSSLLISTDVLADRLATLVEGGVMVRRPYREPGQRARDAYELTPAGRELGIVLGALQQWGDDHLPSTLPSLRSRSSGGRPLTVRFVDEEGRVVPQEDVLFHSSPDGAGQPVR